jgi:hypothetical protein
MLDNSTFVKPLTWGNTQVRELHMESSGSLGPPHSHRISPSLEETVVMLDSIDGFALWLRTEGRPKSVQTVSAYCRAVRGVSLRLVIPAPAAKREEMPGRGGRTS